MYLYIIIIIHYVPRGPRGRGVCESSDTRHEIAFKRRMDHFGIWARFLFSQLHYHYYYNMYWVWRVIVENPKSRFGDLSNYVSI